MSFGDREIQGPTDPTTLLQAVVFHYPQREEAAIFKMYTHA